jgi:protein-arginine kinase activator protein McsA
LAERKLLGCGRCYETFGELLEPLLRRMQRDAAHCGKRPTAQVIAAPISELAAAVPAAAPAKGKSRPPSVRELETLLRLAVAEERYEDAALLRNRIGALPRRGRPARSRS